MEHKLYVYTVHSMHLLSICIKEFRIYCQIFIEGDYIQRCITAGEYI